MDDLHAPLDAQHHPTHELTPEQLDEYEELITRKPAPLLEDQFSWVFHHFPASSPNGSGSGRELTPPLVTKKRKYSDMATQDELNSHAASRKRLAHPKRYAVPPRIRKGIPRSDTDALHSTRGRLWKKQGDRIVYSSQAPNKHALQLRRVHHYTSALLDFAMSFKRSRHVNWHSIRGLYQCLMEHVHPVATKFPSPRMKAWVSYLALFKNMMDLNIEKDNLRKFQMTISTQLSEALSREQAQNLPTPPSGSTSETSLEDIPSSHGVPQQDRSRSTSRPTPPSDSRIVNASQGQSPVTHPPPPPNPDPHTHPSQNQSQSRSQSQSRGQSQGQVHSRNQGQSQSQGHHPPRVAPELPRHGAFTLDWRAAQELMNILHRTRMGYNTGERRENVRDLNPGVLKAHFPRTYARAFGPNGVGNSTEDMRAWSHIHGDDLPSSGASAPFEPLSLADEWEVHDLDEEEMNGGDFPYPHTPEDVVWILVLGKSLLSEMDFLGMADEEHSRTHSRHHSYSSPHSHDQAHHSARFRPHPETTSSKFIKQEPISQTNSPLLPLRDSPGNLRASSSPGASSSSSKSSGGETVIKSELSSS